jgi:hypothetical protein
METLNLVPNMLNPIVECFNLDLPTLPDFMSKFEEDPGYRTSDGFRRFTIRNSSTNPLLTEDQHNYFKDLFYNRVLHLLFSHENYRMTYPISYRTFVDCTDLNATLFKDEIGWEQGCHEDPRIFAASGVFHLQDCNEGTYFPQRGGYEAPTKKFSGAFWANNLWSEHLVRKVTSERMGYLVTLQWKFLPHQPTYE